MPQKQTILRGTFILTLVGVVTRVMGFFYRIFLSRTFHAEGVGLYQLIFPVYALCFSFTAAGIQVALSRIVAKRTALHQEAAAVAALRFALCLSASLSFAVMLLFQRFSGGIAARFLGEPRCGALLAVLSYALPFAAVHSCICGYFLGKQQIRLPALSQLFEQMARIGSVWLFYRIGLRSSQEAHILIAVFGIVCGEFASAAYSLYALRRELRLLSLPSRPSLTGILRSGMEMLRLSTPLTANRVLLNIFQSIEAVSIPLQLQNYGMTVSAALGTYGVLTGMALPCILFPSALTNSVSTMILPAVAQIQTTGNRRELKSLVQKVVGSCFLLGFACMIGFFLLGNFLGSVIFHNHDAGKFILTLAFICPFLYTNTALLSILNGLGRTGTGFLINMIGLTLRILSIFLLIPRYGIRGYLWGLLASQLLVTVLGIAAHLKGDVSR